MADGFLILNERDWQHATPEQRDWMVFNTLQEMNRRLDILEKCFPWRNLYVFAGSMIGGAVMILVLVLLKVKVF